MISNQKRLHSGHVWHVQVATMGDARELVVSGSDDGRVFIWDRSTGRLVNLLLADSAAALVAVPHPVLPSLASGGASGVVKHWTPEASCCN